MKELSIEEKAKAYDEAIEKLRSLHDDYDTISTLIDIKEELENIFPALKESEGERIRGAIIDHLKDNNLTEWAAWLEKQGEKKPVFGMKTPEESLGIDSETYNKIVDECIYGEQKPGDKVKAKQNSDIEKGKWYDCFHLWTIRDAKDGDVLACESGWTCIFKKLNHNSFGEILFDFYCFIDRTGWFCDGAKGHTLNERINGKIYPATKEQRDLLFQKMKEAGYEWNAEKKELKKIEQKPKKCIYSKDNYTDEDRLVLCDGCDEICKLKQKLTWSEEDERLFQIVIDVLDRQNHLGNISHTDLIACVRKLKSLRPQNTWKPSDEQMKALKEACDEHWEIDGLDPLYTLYQDLKKLKE